MRIVYFKSCDMPPITYLESSSHVLTLSSVMHRFFSHLVLGLYSVLSVDIFAEECSVLCARGCTSVIEETVPCCNVALAIARYIPVRRNLTYVNTSFQLLCYLKWARDGWFTCIGTTWCTTQSLERRHSLELPLLCRDSAAVPLPVLVHISEYAYINYPIVPNS